MTAKTMSRFTLLCLILIGVCASLQARSRFEQISNDELLRRSLSALASPDHSSAGLKAKAQALSDLSELRHPPANAEALALDALRGPGGNSLAPYVGRLLLRLDADEWHAIAKLTFSGTISESRGEAALKPFVQANDARVDWRTGDGPARAKAFSTLLQLRALSHDEFAQAIADKDASIRGAAPLVAGFLDLTTDDWQTIVALLHDPEPAVRQGALRALMEDSAPNPSQYDSAVFALRYDPALSSDVLIWFQHTELSQDQIDQLTSDLRPRTGHPQPDPRLALNLLNTLVATHSEKLLLMMAAFASEPDNPPAVSQGALSLIQAAVDRLRQDTQGNPQSEQQFLAKLTPLLRNSAITRPVHDILLSAVAKLQIDTNDLSDLFIRDFALADGSSLSIAEQCLDHANTMNPARLAQAVWQAQHDPDARIAHAARQYTADKQLSGVWMLALKEGTLAEKHEAIAAFEQHGIDAGPGAGAGWPALADCMKDPDASLRGQALRVLVHAAAVQDHIDADSQALLRDVLLAALHDPNARVQRFALAQASSACISGRPEALNAVLAHLEDPSADMQATAWNVLATALPSGIFGDLPQACPGIDGILKQAIWYGPPDIRNCAIRIWDVLHPRAFLPWPPDQIALLLTPILLCVLLLLLLRYADQRERGVQLEDLTTTDDQEEAEYATRSMGSFIIAAALVVALLLLWAATRRMIALRSGMLCGLSLATYLLAGTAITRWGRLIRTGRPLDRALALALVSLGTIFSLFMGVITVAAALAAPDHLPVLLVLAQVAAAAAMSGIGLATIRRIIHTFRTPAPPPVTLWLSNPVPQHRSPRPAL